MLLIGIVLLWCCEADVCCAVTASSGHAAAEAHAGTQLPLLQVPVGLRETPPALPVHAAGPQRSLLGWGDGRQVSMCVCVLWVYVKERENIQVSFRCVPAKQLLVLLCLSNKH